jgi:RES domain-containing protein
VSQQALVAAIDELGTTSLTAEAVRHVSPGREPRSGAGARIHGGRWNPPGSFPTLYLALDVQTVIAEFHRLARRQALAVSAFLPRELHRFAVELEAVLDLRSEAARAAVGLSERALRADDPTACREIGSAAHSIGIEAILAPSAAGSGSVLAVSLDALRPDSRVEALRVEAVWDEPPQDPRRWE